MAANYFGKITVIIKHVVYQKARVDKFAGSTKFFVEAVAFDICSANSGIYAAAKFIGKCQRVVSLNGFFTGNARKNAFAAAAVTCKQMYGNTAG